MSQINPAGSIPAGQLPQDIRKASKEDQNTYRSAMAFERMMVGELLKSAPSLSGESAGGGDEGSEMPAAYKQMLPTTLADSLTSGAGLGIARDMYLQMKDGKS